MRRAGPVLLTITLLLSLLLLACSRPAEPTAGDAPPPGEASGQPEAPGPAPAPNGDTPGGAGTDQPASNPADTTGQGPAPTPVDAGTPPAADPNAGAGGATSPPPEAEPAAPAVGAIRQVPPPEPLRGIHLSGWVAGTPSKRDPLLKWARATGYNAVAIELKSEDGRLSWPSDIPMAREIGSNARKVKDLRETVQMLHDLGFWVIGRVVCFNDPVLYDARPDLRVPGLEGTRFRFVNPLEPTVRRYNLDIALAGAAAGIDEIQFDYIRWAEKRVPGFTLDTTVEFRTAAINSFLEQAVQEIKPLGVYVSADVFGLTTSVNMGDDMHIGQDYAQIAGIVDYVSAMAYPSHYANGTYGIAVPDREPYLTVKKSLEKAIERTPGVELIKHRPWIQDFQYPAAGYMPYNKAEVEGQMRALAELGIHSFLVWDPKNNYTRDVVLPTPGQ